MQESEAILQEPTNERGYEKKQCIEEYVENYEFAISTLDHGYMIRVGCKSFAIESKETLLNMVTRYFNNPGELQKQFRNKTLIIK